MRLELIRVGLLVELTNHYITKGAYNIAVEATKNICCVKGESDQSTLTRWLKKISYGLQEP